MPNVKLAIRVRPFTDRELRSEKDKVPIVNVIDDKTIAITNLKVSASGAGDSRERVRRYHADYTFDSSCAHHLPEYASQETVFESVGRDVLSSLSRLSSVCVLAYGQSATGKTHTMMGTDAQPGLVPRLCRALAREPCDVTVSVYKERFIIGCPVLSSLHFYDFTPPSKVEQSYCALGVRRPPRSFLEIYNERVHDLLAGEDAPAPLPFNSLPRRRGNARKDLRVREHPTRGPYVQNLRRVAVSSADSLLALVAEGARRRRTAATRRNPVSSRSHALLELSTPQATLHLADLAGSEKASWEGCCGGRQKEGANINKSLVALSNVISALVSGSSRRGRFVPYRDSALTWLLKDCFTGGACTFIIATVSPSVACYGESASTLRWSARARQLPPPRAAPLARHALYHALLAELSRHHIRYIPETGKLLYEDCHWALQSKHANHNNLNKNLENEAKIGNLMNMLQPKTDDAEPTTSSRASSDTSDIAPNADDKSVNKIVNEIKNEVDELLGPTLERTKSGSELEIVAPLRHKRHQYRSQEVLSVEKTLHDPSPRQSQGQINRHDLTTKNPQVTILYDNQRAEIVASVTERLYSKLKKKEEAAASKVESMVDKKILEPLNELKICTNARQRLMELSQKALRHKRRIGIPAHTQTRRTVIRVKDQGVDVQTDLESYSVKDISTQIICRDASTETMPMTPRYKDIAVGPKCGSLHLYDKSTGTDIKQVVLKSAFMMTDDPLTLNRHTQTRVLPPPRRKRVMTSKKYIHTKKSDEYTASPIISINISQRCLESESQSSDDNLEVIIKSDNCENMNNVGIPPDLLTNHSNAESVLLENNEQFVVQVDEKQLHNSSNHLKVNVVENITHKSQNTTEDFPEPDDFTLPRVSVNYSSKANQNELKNIIMGRNEDLYPYNIVLSPPLQKENTKRIVKFKDNLSSPEINTANTKISTDLKNSADSECVHNSDATNSEKDYDGSSHAGTSSGSLESGKVDSDSFIWKRVDPHNYKPIKNMHYTPVYKNSSKYRTAQSKLYREFLGLDKGLEEKNRVIGTLNSGSTTNCSSSESVQANEHHFRFLQSKQFFEKQYKKYSIQNDNCDLFEKQILDCCNSLDLSADKYDRYLNNYRRHLSGFSENRTPKKYLQHLVQLRKEVIKSDSDTTY